MLLPRCLIVFLFLVVELGDHWMGRRRAERMAENGGRGQERRDGCFCDGRRCRVAPAIGTGAQTPLWN